MPGRRSIKTSLKTAFDNSKPKMLKVTLDGLDLHKDQSGSLYMASGRLLPSVTSHEIKVRFWLHSGRTDKLMQELLKGNKPRIEIESSDINAVIG